MFVPPEVEQSELMNSLFTKKGVPFIARMYCLQSSNKNKRTRTLYFLAKYNTSSSAAKESSARTGSRSRYPTWLSVETRILSVSSSGEPSSSMVGIFRRKQRIMLDWKGLISGTATPNTEGAFCQIVVNTRKGWDMPGVGCRQHFLRGTGSWSWFYLVLVRLPVVLMYTYSTSYQCSQYSVLVDYRSNDGRRFFIRYCTVSGRV